MDTQSDFPRRPEPIPPRQDLIDLPTLISNEFGVSRSIARQQILMGMVTINGEEWRPLFDHPLTLPRKDLEGAEILVRGRDRSFHMIYEER